MNKKAQFFSALAAIAIISILTNYFFWTENRELKNEIRAAMYDKTLEQRNFADHTYNGVYHPSKYYCVWTQGRSIEEIINTETHEQCHVLLDKNRPDNLRSHFCGAST